TRPYTIAFRTVETIECTIVKITGERGLIGLGAASPEPHVTGETAAACSAALAPDGLRWLEGEDVRALPRLARELARRMPDTPAARAALDMALHDLLARHLDVPLVEMLGRAHDALPTSITIGIKPTSEAVAEAQEYLARGFRVLKVKLGHSLADDLERVRALRAAVGRDVRLRVDPNQGYGPTDLLEFDRATRALELEFLEQPMP